MGSHENLGEKKEVSGPLNYFRMGKMLISGSIAAELSRGDTALMKRNEHVYFCVSLQVAKYTYDGVSMFPEEKIDYVTVEQHTGCECMCKVQESDCNPSLHDFGEWIVVQRK